MLKYIVMFLVIFFINSCSTYNDVDSSPSIKGDIEDNATWYLDMTNEVLGMRITIPTPNDYNCTAYNDVNGSLRPCTLNDVNQDIDPNDDYKPILHVNMQTDEYMSEPDLMNASFQIKGKSTRLADQKSYRIKLDENISLYRKERTFQLNKHPYDASRVRNKLAFDLFIDIPNFTSLKTEFVHLDINSSENNISEVNSSDYGLFTHVEKAGKEFLINRGWREDDNLYKAQDFAFFLYKELRVDSNGEPIDPEAFDSRLEIERGKTHNSLDEMLKAINDPSTNFEEVFSKYFNRNNYITWMAINIVMANKDTVSQNFYLLNPKNSNTFYFLPWDYDGAGRETSEYRKWELGIGTWWGVPLHRRFLEIEQNRIDLDLMVKKLRAEYITPEIIQNKLDIYKPLILPYIQRTPDSDKLSYQRWETEFNSLVPRLDENIQNYESQAGHPMPFWQEAIYADGKLSLSWDRSIDLEGDRIIYELKIAKSPDMNNSIVDEVIEDDLTTNSIRHTVDINLDKGTYYMRVISKELANEEHYQTGFEIDVVVDGINYDGVLEFAVE